MSIDLDRLREWLIAKGVSPEELDEVSEPPVIEDLGKILKVTLENDNQLGELVTSFFMQFNDIAMMVMLQQERIMMLEEEVKTLKGGN